MASTDEGKKEIVNWIHEHFKQGETCLDVGACDGKWSDLLRGYLKMDAAEIYGPNIINNNLVSKYDYIWSGDIKDYKYDQYDLIIFGDVIEHMDIAKAKKVLRYAKGRCKDYIVGVPYLYRQDAIYGNPYEVHIQWDLTEQLFITRYPGHELIWTNGRYGYWHKTK